MMDITFSDGAENVHSPGLACAKSVGQKRKRNTYGGSSHTGNCGVIHNNSGRGSSDNGDARREEESAQPKISECVVGPKFNDFDKLREEANFAVGQTWAIYDTVDGMPRLYAHIRKVSVPSFGLRITYLEPDPDNEKEIRWFEEELPVSVGKFRLANNQNRKDRCKFSHLIQCNEASSDGHFTVFPRKGETWALFKNWDIKWSSQPESHRKYEYEFVEILSDYGVGAGVSVAFLHKAKGFASVFFRMGTGDAHIFGILHHSLYRFSHRVPSFKLTGSEGKGLPKYAYELDQAALPETVEEIIIPSHLNQSKPEALYFPSKEKVFQTGQIWSFYWGYDNIPLYYGRIQKITCTQAFEQAAELILHVGRLQATPFTEDVIQWNDKRMPDSCGTFFVVKSLKKLTPHDVSLQILPQTSMDGDEYTILPKTGEVWAVHRFWTSYIDATDIDSGRFDVVEVLDDALDYKVLELEPVLLFNEDDKKKFLKAAESRNHDVDDEEEVIFTIPKSKRLKFSHQIAASRVTKEIDGDLKELFEVLDSRALPLSVRRSKTT